MRDLLGWPARRWLVAGTGAVAVALAVGLPTALLPNPWFGRMTAVTGWSWPVWAAAAVLAGLVLASYVRTPEGAGSGAEAGTAGGFLGFLAVGCPVCNKLVVALLGTAGALQWWAPLQPLLGAASVVLLAWALRSRLHAERSCPVPAGPPSTPIGTPETKPEDAIRARRSR